MHLWYFVLIYPWISCKNLEKYSGKESTSKTLTVLYLLTSPVIRNILIAFHKRAKANCNHGCCQHFVFQLAMNSGLFLQSKDGCIEANVHSLQKAKLSTCWKAHVKSVQLTGKMLVLSKRVKWWTAPKPRKENREADRIPYRVILNRLITPMVWTVLQWMRIAASFLKAQVLSYKTTHHWSRLPKFLQNEEPELPFRDNWKAYQWPKFDSSWSML